MKNITIITLLLSLLLSSDLIAANIGDEPTKNKRQTSTTDNAPGKRR